MEKIIKYNSFNADIKSGDVVVFTNGAKKIIQKITDGHRVVFEDGTKIDLWIIEDKIEGIVRKNAGKLKPVVTPAYFDPEPTETIKIQCFNSLATSYKELNKKLYHGGKAVEFYHITAVQNALAIFMGDYFYSREAGRGLIKYDNVELNDITNSVMSTNYSWRLEKYARFYLNIKNKATYAMHKNYMKYGSFGVIVAVDFSAIWKSKTKVILSPVNAHGLVDSDFDWSKYNIGFEINVKNLDASRFDLKRTYSACDFNEDNPYLAAEILFYEKIDLSNVSHIYFRTTRERDIFLNKLPYNKRTLLSSKCVVREELFW